MSCPSEATLGRFAAGQLDPAARLVVEGHVTGCAICARALTGVERTIGQPMVPADASQPRLTPLLGRYRILETLGEGGMGTVYLAHDPQLDRKVALKVLRRELGSNSEARGRMIREAQTMAKLAHPNIVTVFDTGEADGSAYISMELVSGVTLESWLTSQPRAVPEILGAFVTAGRALAAAHDAGVVHRDFKPTNVLVDRAGRIAVTDFGLASTTEYAPVAGPASRMPSSRSALTQPGAIMGTPAYMSPEQYKGAKVDARTDQFSFAVSLYEALFGSLPFAGESFEERRDRPDWRLRPLGPTHKKRVPARVYEALAHALSPDPAARFPTLHAMLDELAITPERRATPLALGIGVASVLAVAAIAAGGALALRDTPQSSGETVPQGTMPVATSTAAPTATPPRNEPVPSRLAELSEKVLGDRAKRGGWKVVDARKLEAELVVTLMRRTDAASVVLYDSPTVEKALLVADSCRHQGSAVDRGGTRTLCATIEHDLGASRSLLKLLVP